VVAALLVEAVGRMVVVSAADRAPRIGGVLT